MAKFTPIAEDGHFDMETFDTIMNVNFRAAVSLTMKCLPHLKTTKGAIVNVSSVASCRPARGMMGYCISKTALDGFTKALAAELAACGVRVNSVNPGPIPSNIDRDMEKAAYSPKDRSLETVAPSLEYLHIGLSDESSMTILPAD
uniref:Uncharacterized protein n=1 Tax=Romanomermis culicivorax TaxID=13658 RepID=A0A915J0X6_ROMCU